MGVAMLTVGIKELKAKLSRYIEQAHAGEEIVVTDHGREVAMVIPISPERRAVKRLGEDGRVGRAGNPEGKAALPCTARLLPKRFLRKDGDPLPRHQQLGEALC